jgi:hypothetical protein
MSSSARLLCTGDLHVGRFPSYVPPDDRSLSVEAKWSRTVDRVIQEAVDAVVLTGDVADEDNKLFEAFGPLKDGVECLAAAGVRTFAVAGNHDYDALHRLADLLDPSAFTLLEAFGNGGAFATSTAQTAGYAVQASFGGLLGPGFALVHLRAERGYDAGPLTELSVLLDSTDTASRAFRQENVYLKAPEREDRAIVSAEYRYYPAGLNGRLAIAPRFNWRPYVSGDGDRQTSLELPLIFFPDMDGNLVGGLKAAWRIDEDAFGVRAFIGAKFDFFRP